MIPHIIHQTWKTKDIPKWARKWYKSWDKYNSECQHVLWTDLDNRQLIKTHAPWFLHTYDTFPIHIQRVDSVRYLILYLYGGCYADLDFECVKSIAPFLNQQQSPDIILSYSSHVKCITNSIMMSKAKCVFWLHVLKMIQKSKPQQWYERSSLYVLRSTGPLLIHKAAQKYKSKYNIQVLPKHHFLPYSMLSLSRVIPMSAFGAHHHKCTWSNDQLIIKLVISACGVIGAVLALRGIQLIRTRCVNKRNQF